MKRQRILASTLVLVLLLALALGLSVQLSPHAKAQEPGLHDSQSAQAAPGAAAVVALSTSFTYQGHLTDGGGTVSDTCDFRFRLYDAASSGTQIGSTQTANSVALRDGRFTVQLDFGSGAFQGDGRWLQVAVRCPAGSGSYTTLAPRHALTPVPYALALPGLRTQQNLLSPNLIGGYSGNSVIGGVAGATIGGGGGSDHINEATASFATIGGGLGNTASGEAATVGGGRYNAIFAPYGTIAGGGHSDPAQGNRVTDEGGTVGGGGSNQAGNYATVGGGWGNTASGWGAAIGGGRYNTVEAPYGTIAGGGYTDPTQGNRVTDEGGTVGGGGKNQAGNNAGSPTDAYFATVGGGWDNTANGKYTTVSGGADNHASGDFATVGGGWDNTANGKYTTVSGGAYNHAWGDFAAVPGGQFNTAEGDYSTVSGGADHYAWGDFATVPGGQFNTAGGHYSFAAGFGGQAIHGGSFVWSSAESTSSWYTNTFTVRAHGGVRFYSAPGTGTGMQLSSHGTSWGSISDRNVKETFAAVDADRLLDTLAAMPIQTWNLKSQPPGIRHIGPVAQDFNGMFDYLFGEVESPIHINNMDAVGVSLAAIQGLYQVVQEKDDQIAAQQGQIAALEARLGALERAVEANSAPATTFSPSLSQLWLPFSGLLLAGLVLGQRRIR